MGAQAIGSTSYPIPGGAISVYPGGMQAAVNRASSGATLVLHGGIYREAVNIPTGKALTVQPYPNQAVWFSGSVPVGGWVPDGGAWRRDNWTSRLSRDGLTGTMLIGADPRAGYPDMVFIDGRALFQVASRSAVRAGTFYLDESTSRLYIGSSPSGHSVEATVLSSALEVRGAGSVIRGIGFEHYGSSISYGAAVRGWQSATFENDAFVHNAAAGLGLHGNDNVRRVTAISNGQLGIQGYLADHALIRDSVVSSNNTERFNPESAAGGIKMYLSTDVTVSGNVVNDNIGHAIWFDSGSNRGIASRNLTQRNARGAGVMFENSDTAIIAGNISTDNEAGLQAGEASNVQVWNNTMINNQYSFQGYQASRGRTVNITVRNNIMAAGPSSNRQVLIAEDITHTSSWRDMNWSSNNNAFYRRSTSTTPSLCLLSNYPLGILQFQNLGQIVVATGQESHSLSITNSSSNSYLGPNYAPAGAAVGAGAPLPASVAAALGRQTSTIGAPIG